MFTGDRHLPGPTVHYCKKSATSARSEHNTPEGSTLATPKNHGVGLLEKLCPLGKHLSHTYENLNS